MYRAIADRIQAEVDGAEIGADQLPIGRVEIGAVLLDSLAGTAETNKREPVSPTVAINRTSVPAENSYAQRFVVHEILLGAGSTRNDPPTPPSRTRTVAGPVGASRRAAGSAGVATTTNATPQAMVRLTRQKQKKAPRRPISIFAGLRRLFRGINQCANRLALAPLALTGILNTRDF